jgi:glycosyltransferase involved in cell wall biosynthesis
VAPAAYPVLAADRSIPFVGGAEVQQSFIAAELARRGHDVSMITMDHGQEEGGIVRGVRVLKMHRPDAGVPVLRFFHPRLTSLWAAMRRADADVYYQRAAGALTGFVAAFARRHGRRAIFAGAHDVDFEPALPLIPLRRDKALFRFGVSRVDRIVVQTERQVQMCRDVYCRTPVRINSCYAYQGHPGRPDGVILWVGSVKPFKRPEIFLDMAQRLPHFLFRLVGGAAAGQEHFLQLQQRAQALGNVEMTGFIPHADVESHFDGASLLVNTSTQEGFPNTFLQAWARGIPTVSFFDTGACLAGDRVGRVVGDLAAMTNAVDDLKKNVDVWTNEGARAREYLNQHHGIAAAVDAYEQLLHGLITAAPDNAL